jgi:hypothetical protein
VTKPSKYWELFSGVKVLECMITPSVQCQGQNRQVLGNLIFMLEKLRVETKYSMQISTKLSVFRPEEVI